MVKLFAVSLAAGALLAGSVTAQEAPATPSAPAEASSGADAGSDRDKVICRYVKPPTGTRVGSSKNRQRICQTKAEWEQQAAEAQDALKIRDRGAFDAPRTE